MAVVVRLLAAFIRFHVLCIAVCDVISRTSITAFQLEYVILPCAHMPTNGTPPYRIDWHFHNLTHSTMGERVSAGVVIDGCATRFVFNTTDYSLGIYSATSADTGYYMCSNNFNGDSSSVRLCVLDMDVPSIKSEILVFAGDDVKMLCSVDKISDRVDWLRQRVTDERAVMVYSSGDIVNGFAGRFRVESNSDLHRDLSIQNVEPGDAGFYECFNPVEPRTKTVVRVQVFPERSSRPAEELTATTGEMVTLPCRTSQDWTPKSWWYQWHAGASLQQISYDGTVCTSHGAHYILNNRAAGDYSLVVRNANEKDSGLYSCIEVLSTDEARRTRIHLEVAGQVEVYISEVTLKVDFIAPIGVVIIFFGFGVTIIFINIRFSYHPIRTQDAEP